MKYTLILLLILSSCHQPTGSILIGTYDSTVSKVIDDDRPLFVDSSANFVIHDTAKAIQILEDALKYMNDHRPVLIFDGDTSTILTGDTVKFSSRDYKLQSVKYTQ